MIDTSALVRATRLRVVAERLRDIPTDHRFVCLPIMLELGVGARNTQDYASQLAWIRAGTHQVAITPEVETRTVAVQGLLAARGQHRSARLADLIIAAAAEANGLTVLHYDSDYDIIAAVTGQPVEWVVERGSVS